ncbi:MAG TPA: ATPase domain-containing protein [Methanomassiliicoccales archaeon]|nr:ATPase domain-containing protein [Methanomassiliicoccales archaeon]HXZ23516.1 ATPase domain-containing protein [Methanomassiliicoccales archaeon]
MSSSEKRLRYRTYVDGFDENLGGGIPQGHVSIIAGAAGTMKSSLAYHILYQNAKRDGVNGLYVSLEQSKESLVRQMEELGLKGETLGRLEVLDLAEIHTKSEGAQFMDTFRFAINETKKRINYELLVIDSMGALEMVSNSPRPRDEAFRLFEWLRSLGITAFIISEMPVGPYTSYGLHDTDFLSDGIIHLKMVEVSDTEVQRRLRCVKMRETDHSTNYFSFFRNERGFAVTRAITDF